MPSSVQQASRDPGKQSGWVLSVGLVLLVTIVVIGLAAGIGLVRNAWFKKLVVERSHDVYVIDQNDQVLGKAVDFDEHETPLVPFVDYDVAGGGDNYRVLVGIRDDRFTSRERIYYTDTKALDCTGQACIFEPSTEIAGGFTTNSIGVDDILGTGGVSYQIATQAGGGPGTQYNYGIGSTKGGLPGRLYRQTATACTVNVDPNVENYITYWQSQRVVATGGGGGPIAPCYKELFFEPTVVGAATKCQDPWVEPNNTKDACCQPGDPTTKNCDATTPNYCTRGAFQKSTPTTQFFACNCPAGWIETDGAAGWCCPPGSDPPFTPGQCQQLGRDLTPAAGTWFEAEEVLHPKGGNVLDGLGNSFRVSLPIDPDDFETTPPPGEQ